MIKSMTGYGKTEMDIPGNTLTIEIKSLNSKGLDLNIKVPVWFRERELDIRNQLVVLQRGKVDLIITAEPTGGELTYAINRPLVLRYHEELKQLLRQVQEECPGGLLPLVMKMPDVIQSCQKEMDPQIWEEVRSAIDKVIHQVDTCREREGVVLAGEFSSRLQAILRLLDQVDPFEAERTELVRTHLQKELALWISSEGAARVDPNRFEQELIYYLERIDFTEEKVRLRKHCDYFLETMDAGASQGKKLGFIGQEMGREINTLGSKAYHAEIQKIVVGMKDELEKIKEQLFNIL